MKEQVDAKSYCNTEFEDFDILESTKDLKEGEEAKRMYIARDENGELYLHIGKPEKDEECESWFTEEEEALGLHSSLFPNVKWEDKEPTEVELVIKSK